MDASISNLSVEVCGLRSSIYPEDRLLAKKCDDILEKVLASLKPILKYVCEPWKFYNSAGCVSYLSVRCLYVGIYNKGFEKDTRTLVLLSEKGVFFEARDIAIKGSGLAIDRPIILCDGDHRDSENVAKRIREGDMSSHKTWNQLRFLDVITRLREVLAEAEKNRRKHLEAVASRREMLDKMLAVLGQSTSAR